MTYYEELGISATASLDEIHDAYRQLARLLHPDLLHGEAAQRLAECQMKRLNGVYAVLSHTEKRRHYDLSLRGDRLALAPASIEDDLRVVWRERLAGMRRQMTVWTAAAGLVILMLVWTFADYLRSADRIPPVTVQKVVGVQPLTARQTPQTDPRAVEYLEGQVHYWRRQAEQMRGERDATVLQMGKLEGRITELAARAALSMMMSRSQTSTPGPLQPANPDPARSPPLPSIEAPRTLSGSWYYLRPPNSPLSPDVYPPEFIEALIVEENGVLRGKYRARYRVTDRAISPDVMFQFSGKAGYDSARLPWHGAAGARGEVRLRLLTQNSMEVGWIANELGSSQGLGSGTAVLVRRVEQ